jgi:phospholipase/carboxylesterase
MSRLRVKISAARVLWDSVHNPEESVTSGNRTEFSRRELLAMGLVGIEAALLSGCEVFKGISEPAPLQNPVLSARPTATAKTFATVGTTVPFQLGPQLALLYLPPTYTPNTPIPLVLMFPQENATAISALSLFQPYADAAGLALLAVDASSTTWDIINGAYGPDVDFINAALTSTFTLINVDSTRVAVEGFSDGASYALAVGLTNGDLFSHIIAFSAGILPPYQPVGMPKIFISHGTNDPQFPISQSGQFFDNTLTSRGYTVDYQPFDGVHEIPDAIVQAAIAWLAT